jgi:DNA-binding response OmpR family regulator
MGRFLVVEDEFLLAAHIDLILADEGHEVIGPVGTLDEALQIAKEETIDGALLDVNINGDRIDEVAATLERRRVPFIFVTGYGCDNLPAKFRDTIVVRKPFREDELLREVRRLAPLGA